MNVLHYLNYKAPYKGNFIPSIEALEKALCDRKDNFYWMFPVSIKETSAMTWVKGYERTNDRVSYLSDKNIVRLWQMNRFICHNHIDILHFHFHTMRDVVMARLIMMCHPKTKVVIHFHNQVRDKNNWTNFLRNRLYDKCYLVGVSASVSKKLTEVFPNNHCFQIENAIDFHRLEIGEQVIGEQSNEIKCLIFGYDYYIKGVDLAIDAVNQLVSEGVHIQLIISLSTNHEVIRSRIIEQLGILPKWIKIISAQNNVADLYNSMDVFLAISREEGFCYSAVEAEYCDCMVVCSDIPVLKELQLPTALVVNKGNIDSIKQGIISAVNQKVNKKSNLVKCRDKLKEHYDLEVWTDRLLHLYDEIIG